MIESEVITFLRSEQVEHLIGFKKDICIFHYIGTRDSVSVDRKELYKFNNVKLYHNHINGSSFSESDIVEGIENNVSIFFLITKNHIYSISRPKLGWKVNFNEEEVLNNFKKSQEFAIYEIQKLLNNNEIRSDEVDLIFNHYIWVLFFAIYEIPYQKKAF